MCGLLVPSWYITETPSELSLALITFMFGFSTALAAVTAVTIIHQANRTWRRSKKVVTHPYIVMVFTEWLSSVIISIISFLFIFEVIPPSFWLFFSILCLWVLQIQCIMHIIINRIALIMCDPGRVRKLKWVVTLLIGAINISVFVIWMPARLQINADWIHLNDIWDRVEKGIFLLIDLGLNLYFLYVVRSELIDHGLKKYWNLYWFNVGMIFISISLDVGLRFNTHLLLLLWLTPKQIILIGIMSLPKQSTFVYVQFHPLMYLVKLKIEMNMADLIVKIVKATSLAPGHELHRYAAMGSLAALPQRPGFNAARRNSSDNSSNSDKPTIPPSHLQHDISPGAKPSNKSSYSNEQGWTLTRLPTNFDAGDVVDTRKISVAEGDVGMVTLAPLTRPVLMRNMSELTQLEVRNGYVDRDAREKRTSGSVEQSPV